MPNIPILRPFIAHEAASCVSRTLKSGWIGEGERVREFEAAISGFINNPLFLTTNSCTSAISLALTLANLKPEDEVITTPFTCIATNLPILHSGSTIRWADIGVDGTIDLDDVASLITERTKLVVVVHFGGYPAAVDKLQELLAGTTISVLEDAAHALGTAIDGVRIGNHSRFVCYSFQAVKMLTTVDGGGLALQAQSDYERARRLRWFGIDRRIGRTFFDDVEDPGYRLISNDVLASIGLANFEYLDQLLESRRAQAGTYAASLVEYDGIEPCHPVSPSRSSSFWLYPILVDRREEFIQHMAGRGIECSMVHKRNDTYRVFRKFRRHDLKGVDLWDEKMVCLPIGHWLTEENIQYILECIRAGW